MVETAKELNNRILNGIPEGAAQCQKVVNWVCNSLSIPAKLVPLLVKEKDQGYKPDLDQKNPAFNLFNPICEAVIILSKVKKYKLHQKETLE